MKRFYLTILFLALLLASVQGNPNSPLPQATPVELPSKPVALLSSEATSKALGWRWDWEWRGAAHCLEVLGVDYEVISPEQLSDWNGELLILPNIRNMNAGTIAEIQSKKVPVLASYMSSYRSEDNSAWKENNFALSEYLGVDFDTWVDSNTRADRLVLEKPLGRGEVLMGRQLAMLVKPRQGTQVLARWPGGEAAIVESSGGIYLGQDLFCPENSDSRPVLQLLAQLLNRFEPGLAQVPQRIPFSELPKPPFVPLLAMGETVRVGMGDLGEETLLRAGQSLEVNGKTGPKFHRWTKGQALSVKGSPYLEVLRLRANGTYSWSAYRGKLEISKNGTLVNTLDFEEYLAGVVPSEVPAYFPQETLRAMAVVARTYGLTHLGRHDDFDVCATVHCQVYRGLENEAVSSNRAVLQTAGERLTFDGKSVKALFHAVCGGSTASPVEVWQGAGPIAYLPSRADGKSTSFCADSGRFRWSQVFTDRELQETLASGLKGQLGSNFVGLSTLSSVKITARHPSGRVKTLRIEGPEKSYEVEGDAIRWLFSGGKIGTSGLQSTLFTIDKTETGYQIRGGGWGHGVGLCQQGAFGRAKAGHKYQDILQHYYPGTVISKGEISPEGKAAIRPEK